MYDQKIYIFDSPDGTGKTEIAKELSRRIQVPYFKMTTEHENWRKGTFIDALRFDQTYLAQFLKQTRHSAIIDRAFPAEWVYSRVFGRMTDHDVLNKVDADFAELGARIIMPLRRDYTNTRDDEVVPREKYQAIHNMYLQFSSWTKCSVVQLYVDDFENKLSDEIHQIYQGLDDVDYFKCKRVSIRGKL